MTALSLLSSRRFKKDPQMEVLCACDERYLPHAATMLCSLLTHNRGIRIHFFYSAIANRELAKLKSLVARDGSELVFYEIASSAVEGLRVDKHASGAVYYRLLAPGLLPTSLDKVLYLDCDIIVRRSLLELWNTDITDYALAAVSDLWEEEYGKALGLPMGAKYFNSGVLLINLQFWRENGVPERVVSFIRGNPEKAECWDQDGLNATLVDQWRELPRFWNAQIHESRAVPLGTEKNPAIVHFVTGDKPWFRSNKHPFKDEYHKYRLKTAWRRYKQVGEPHLLERFRPSLQSFARVVLPGRVRRWLRSRILKFPNFRGFT
jgi:lipopolysaccharide biosynthesis glycosyltransferase